MATYNTGIVTALASGFQRKNDYRGNVQAIPVEFSTDGTYSTDTLVMTTTLPPNTTALSFTVKFSAIASGALIIKTGSGTTLSNSIAMTSAGDATVGLGNTDVGGTTIVGTLTGTMSSDTIEGVLYIATDE